MTKSRTHELPGPEATNENELDKSLQKISWEHQPVDGSEQVAAAFKIVVALG